MFELNGLLYHIAFPHDSDYPILSLSVKSKKEELFQMFDKLKGVDPVAIKIGKATTKRSLDANSYYWLLLGKLSKALNISNPYCHNLMLRRYGTFEEFDGQVAYWVLPDTDDATKKADEAETYHIKPTSQVRQGKDGVMYRTYILLKGSHDYTKEEFSKLLEGLVDECKHAGIETRSKEEIDSLLGQWGQPNG